MNQRAEKIQEVKTEVDIASEENRQRKPRIDMLGR